jgi:hypothetical protein
MIAPTVAGAAAESTDPVFAAIEVHRAAHLEYERARDLAGRAYQALPLEARRPQAVKIGSRKNLDGSVEPVFASDHDRINKAVKDRCLFGTPKSRSQAKLWGREKHLELAAAYRRRAALLSEVGYTAAENEHQDAEEKEFETVSMLVATTPTTVAGCAAFVQYMIANDRKHADKFEDEDPGFRIVVTLERALSAIAGGKVGGRTDA